MFYCAFSKNTSLPTLVLLTMAFLAGSTNMAMAQAATMGDLFCNLWLNAKPFGLVFQYVAYIAGAALMVQGIYHLRGSTESPQNFPLHRGLMLLFGAACLLSLPAIASTIVTTIYGQVDGSGTLSCSATASPGGTELDTMLSGFVYNIKAPLTAFVSLVSILCGLFMIIRGLMKAGKYGFDPKTHSITSILTHIIFGAVLMTIGQNLNLMLASVFGIGTPIDSITSSSVLGWGFVAAVGGGSPQFANAIAAALTFVQLIGVIAFVRGWLVMKKVVEGGGNVTMAQGITHILGGVLAINISTFLHIMDSTFGTNLL